MARIKVGDTFTVAGVRRLGPNPDRAWWQFWRPRLIESAELQTYKVVAST
jgi:hypothetical protein